MIRKRPQYDLKNPPGQIVTSPPAAVKVKSLKDYIERVQREENPPKKLTCDEWFWCSNIPGMNDDINRDILEDFRACWNASRENL